MKILANGEIVADDDPRVRRQSGPSAVNDRTTDVNTSIATNSDVVAHGPTSSIFDSLDQRLSAAGVPTWNIGPYPVSPVVSFGFLASFLFMGFRGLIFSGLLFFVVNYSRSGAPNSTMFGFRRSNTDNHMLGSGAISHMRTSLTSQNTTGNKGQEDPKKKYFTGMGHRLS